MNTIWSVPNHDSPLPLCVYATSDGQRIQSEVRGNLANFQRLRTLFYVLIAYIYV